MIRALVIFAFLLTSGGCDDSAEAGAGGGSTPSQMASQANVEAVIARCLAVARVAELQADPTEFDSRLSEARVAFEEVASVGWPQDEVKGKIKNAISIYEDAVRLRNEANAALAEWNDQVAKNERMIQRHQADDRRSVGSDVKSIGDAAVRNAEKLNASASALGETLLLEQKIKNIVSENLVEMAMRFGEADELLKEAQALHTGSAP